MDLSENNLSGEIPDFFEDFSSLQLLNLSFNSLEGIVPAGGAFSNSSKVFIQGNKDLCTRTPMLQLPLCTAAPTKRKKTLHIISIVVPLATAILVLMSVVTAIIFKNRNQTEQHIDQPLKELKKFSTECEVLRNTRHRNLMRVISVCSSFDETGNEFKALVLDYMANGNLESWLHLEVYKQKQKRPLSLGSRIIIAMDIAAALDYLHNWCTPPLVHCDLKPSNVLMDDAMCAHVSDYGLAKFLCGHSSASLNDIPSINGPRGSVGYIAPEYGMGCEISSAGDVYSYGVILLEILTGKHPTDDIFKDGLNLHKLVVSAFPEDIGDILESSLIPYYKLEEANHNSDSVYCPVAGIQNCIIQMTKLGLKCSMDSPKDRPPMQDAYAEMIMIKDTFSALQG